MITILVFFGYLSVISTEMCGPLGYPSKTLLSPSYWYFDLPHRKCPPKPADHFTTYSNSSSCRIYFNVCKRLTYQCSGTVCVRYMEAGWDLVSLLGEYRRYPFTEWIDHNDFMADYVGERLMCKRGEVNIKTKFYFNCDVNSTWPIKISASHGGAKSPDPEVSFDDENCQMTFNFNYSEACFKPSKHDSLVIPISTGTFMIILILPGLVLYFIMGLLFNCFRGKKGKDVIPHKGCLVDLPELILDGMMFTVAIIKCRKEERYESEYEPV